MRNEAYHQELPHVLDYFIRYEDQCRYYENNLNSKTEGSDITLSYLTKKAHTEQINNYVISKSLEQLKAHIKNTREYKKKQLILTSEHEGDLRRIYQAKDLKLFKELLLKIGLKSSSNDQEVKKANRLIQTNNFTICCPVIEKFEKINGRRDNHIKTPVVTFHCSIVDNSMEVSKYYINFNALKIMLGWLLNTDSETIEQAYIKNIPSLLAELHSFQNKNILDILSFINDTIGKEFNVSDFQWKDFNNYEEWIKTEKLFILVEELDELYQPIFKEEIKKIREYYTKHNAIPSLLKRYLGYEESCKEFNPNTIPPYFHLGSYTNAYPVNLKQWYTLCCARKAELLAVSGPPGTGKTTLLKELIANEITLKAQELDKCWDAPWTPLRDNEIHISPLGGTNYRSIVITSTNNKAIDNIGEELSKEINFCKNLLGKDNFSGTFCGQMGNSNKFKSFIELCTSFMTRLESAEYNQDAANAIRHNFQSACLKISDMAQDMELLYEEKIVISEKTRSICTQYGLKGNTPIEVKEELEILMDGLNKKAEQFSEIEKQYKENISVNIQQLEKMESNRNNLKNEIKINNQEITKLNNHIKQLHQDYERFSKLKKWGFLYIFITSWRNLKKKYANLRHIDDLILQSNNKMQIREQIVENTTINISKISDEIKQINKKLSNFEDKYKQSKQTAEKAEEQRAAFSMLAKDFREHLVTYQNNFRRYIKKSGAEENQDLNVNWFALTNTKFILELRNNLFKESLKLMEQFILRNKDHILKNLKVIIYESKSNDYDNGWFNSLYRHDNNYSTVRQQLLALWETIFLCFPVVTTTLHSFKSNYSNFKQLLSNMFDLLLVDEAGQIMPHYLCGPMFRANRAVVVGDVRQIKPIRAVKEDLLEGCNDINPSRQKQLCLLQNSAQDYANSGSSIWENLNSSQVGIILNEHRRCERSIMEFSNKYVYNNQLILHKGDNHNKPFGCNLVAIDVRGIKDLKQHYNQMEIDVCSRIVKYILKNYSDQTSNNIAIISPFRKQSELLITATGIECGTVHSFQGQERKCILFSTVFDSVEKQPGLVNFIGNMPNMLNVALSRAKNQFILVGNLEEISKSFGYLNKVYNVILEKGKILSLYRPEAEQLSSEDLQLLCLLLGESPKGADDPIGQYLEENFSRGIIETPDTHKKVFNFIVKNFESSLFISSPWITNEVVNEKFLEYLRQKLDHGLDVQIHYGYRKVSQPVDLNNSIFLDEVLGVDYSHEYKAKAKDSLLKLHKQIGNKLVYSAPTHAKILIIDGKYAIIGSFNWLSNSGQSPRKEVSCIISRVDTVSFLLHKFKSVKI